MTCIIHVWHSCYKEYRLCDCC